MRLALAATAVGMVAPLAFAVPGMLDPSQLVGPDVVKPATFGMHAIAPSTSGVAGVATVRLWDTDTTWRVLNPARGVYRWDTLDRRVQDAVTSGTTVLLVLGGTPSWAAESSSEADAFWLGAGSASPPRSIPDWSAFVDAVVKRYGGRIEAYQIWNEPADPAFWRGSWEVLARMTKAAADVIRAHDSTALTVAAPLILRGPRWRTDSLAYINALADRGMPVDAMAFHGYPAGPPGPSTSRPIASLRHLLANSRAAGLPLWETEVNFTHAPLAGRPRMPAAIERAWLARAYLDAVRFGIERVYWYAYADLPDHLAVDVRRTSVSSAFSAISSWMADARFRGCSDAWQGIGGVTGCAFLERGGRTAVTLWAREPQTLTPGRGTARDLQGNSWSVTSELQVGDSPVWFVPAPFAG